MRNMHKSSALHCSSIVYHYKYVTFTGVESSDDGDLSAGAVVAITTVVTFVITLVVTSLISVFITSLYFKLWYERRRNKDGRPPDDREASTPGDDPYIPTGTTIKMDINPAYATTNY